MMLSLIDLKKALVGEIGMSDDLDALGDSLFNAQLPAMFSRLAPKTEKGLAAWMVHFGRRIGQYAKWIEFGEPTVIWLSGFDKPESYLTALIQTVPQEGLAARQVHAV